MRDGEQRTTKNDMQKKDDASKPKKGLYHSELSKMGAVRVTVKTDVLESTFKGKPPYCVLIIDGHERNYACENEACEEALNGLAGRSVMLEASGREDTAEIKILGAGQPQGDAEAPVGRNRAPQPDTRQPRQEARRERPAARHDASGEPMREERPQDHAAPPQTPPAARKKDAVDTVIDLRKFYARRGNALVMAALESMRVLETFHHSTGLPWDKPGSDEIKKRMAAIIAEELTKTTFTTLFISADRARNLSRPEHFRLDEFVRGDIQKLMVQAKARLEEQAKAKAQPEV